MPTTLWPAGCTSHSAIFASCAPRSSESTSIPWSGISSVGGASGCFHASENLEGSCRIGFPDIPRDWIGSSAFASISRCLNCMLMSESFQYWHSLVASQIVPVQTPAAPIASAAARCLPLETPPAASTIVSLPRASSTTSGTSVKVPTVPLWPPES